MGTDTLEIVTAWRYLGITFHRLASFKTHIKKLKLDLQTKQLTLINYFKMKHLIIFIFHKKLFEAVVLYCLSCAAPVWAWPLADELETIQNPYYRCLLNLPFLTPDYLLQKELKILPLQLPLFKATINFWKKIITNTTPENA